MIILRSLRVHNFKGLRDVDIVLPRQGAILVSGSNEAGKSTLFEAIYFALYGALLVTDDNKGALQDGIAYDAETANVNLTLEVGGTLLVVNRTIRRKGAQVATLTINAPGREQEDIAGVRPVNNRVLGELGGLNGESLLNSCFVEQKKLSKLEDLNYADRERSMLQLLNLEHMSDLEQEYKIRLIDREQLELAKGRAHVAELRQELADIITHLGRLALERAAGEYAQALGLADTSDQTASEAAEARKRLLEQLSEVQVQLEAVVRAHTTQRIVGDAQVLAQRLSGELAQAANQRTAIEDLDRREQVELPALHLAITELRQTADGVRNIQDFHAQAGEARTRADRATSALQHASNLVKALESARSALTQAELDCRQRANDLVIRERAASTDLPAVQRRIGQLEQLVVQDQQLQTLIARMPVDEAARDRAREAHVDLLVARRGVLEVAADAERAAIDADDADAQVLKVQMELAQADELAALSDWLAAKETDQAVVPLAVELGQARADLQRAEDTASSALSTSGQARRHVTIAGGVGVALVVVLAISVALHTGILLAIAGVALLVAACTTAGLARQAAAFTRAVSVSTQRVSDARSHTHALELRHAAMASDDVAARRRALAAEHLTTVKAQIPTNEEEARARIRTLADGAADAAKREDIALRVQSKIATAHQVRATAERAVGVAEASRNRLAAMEAESRDLALQAAERQIADRHDRITAQERVVLGSRLDCGLGASDTPGQALGAARGEEERLTQLVEGITTAASALEQACEGCHNLTNREQEIADELKTIDRQTLELERDRAWSDAQTLDNRSDQELTAIRPLLLAYQLEPNLVEVERRVAESEQKLRQLEVDLSSRVEKESQYDRFSATAESTRQEGSALLSSVLGTLREASCDAAFDFTIQSLTIVRAALAAHIERLDEDGLSRRRHQITTDIDQAQETIRIQTAQAVQWRRAAAEAELVIRQALGESEALTLLTQPPPLDVVVAAIATAESKRLVEASREADAAAKWQLVGIGLDLADCAKIARDLDRNHAVRVIACKLLREARTRMVQRVLPNTETNMRILLPLLTENRYLDAQITDYQIRVWDDRAQSFKSKSIFSGGTKDQFSLALRLSFALAALPQELGTTPGFIFLDEVMSAADDRRALAIQELLTRGPIAGNFAQILVVSHGKDIDTTLFPYQLVLANGKVVESNLPSAWEPYAVPAAGMPPTLAAVL